VNREAQPRAEGRRVALALGIALAAVAVIAAAALLARGRTRPDEVRIDGVTVDGAGAPLADVVVNVEIAPAESEGELPVERVSTRSDARGRFSVRCRVPWKEPAYSVEASKPGFETVTIDDADELPSPLTLRLAAASHS
jgi:hypothetical protein